MSRPLTGYPDQTTTEIARVAARAAGFDAIAEVITELRRRLIAAEDALAEMRSRPPLPTGGETR